MATQVVSPISSMRHFCRVESLAYSCAFRKDSSLISRPLMNFSTAAGNIYENDIETTESEERRMGGKFGRKKNDPKRNGKAPGKKMKKSGKSKHRRNLAHPPPWPTVGENGRTIMTHQEMGNNALVARMALKLNAMLNRMNNLKQKMLFEHSCSHENVGTEHRPMFKVTQRTAINADIFSEIPADLFILDGGLVELCNTGISRSKKEATQLASVDFFVQLGECGIDFRNPPNVQKMLEEKEKERVKILLRRAQMLLELLGTNRPKYDMEIYPPNRHVSTVSLLLENGEWLEVDGKPGKNKKEAQNFATLAGADQLEVLLGKERLDRYTGMIESSPAGHMASLNINPLPWEAKEALEEALDFHEERIAELESVQATFEEKHNSRTQASLRHTMRLNLSNTLDGESLQMRNKKEKLNKVIEAEESRRLEDALSDPDGPQSIMNVIRDALPIKAIREDLLEALKTNQVVVVSGGTGSGKSTQCPQYILEDAIARGEGVSTNIIVTQPRRIAASSVAERIANERGEKLGNSVGYRVRLRGVSPRESGCIEFVTTGVLLRRMVSDPSLGGVSHVVIDEVHERDINTDFLLVLLKDLLVNRPDLRVVLMSATLDAQSFSDYFDGGDGNWNQTTPLLSVPTEPRYPVDIIHLEDFVSEDGKTYGINIDGNGGSIIPNKLGNLAQLLLKAHDKQLHFDLTKAEDEKKMALFMERQLSGLEGGTNPLINDCESEIDLESGSARLTKASSRVRTLRRAVEMRHQLEDREISSEKIEPPWQVMDTTVALLAKVAEHLAGSEMNEGRNGSILCFLPGLHEIKAAMSHLEKCQLCDRLTILPLHSTIPQMEQQRVFSPATEGKVKVILATNIAESSVTIDDVLAIVDSGLVREMGWDAHSAMSTMRTVPASRVSATQRTGRAGRVAPGKCYRLYSRGVLSAMPERPVPEIQSAALEAVCLQTCSMTREGVQTFLSRAIDPPPEETVAFALDRLEKLGAINVSPTGEALSPLGRLLSRFPLDPAIAKMLVTGCVMQCLDPVLTAAACYSSRDPFFQPILLRDEAKEIRRSFSENSDMMAKFNAYNEFGKVREENGWKFAREWASENFVSVAAMKTIESVRSQLLNELTRIGLVQNRDLEPQSRRKKVLKEDAAVNKHASNESLFTAVWATGLPGNLTSRSRHDHFGRMRTRAENSTELHPSSVAFYRRPPTRDQNIRLPDWFFYHEMVLSSQIYLRKCTPITPTQIMLFGGSSLDHSFSHLVLDDWILADSRCKNTVNILWAIRREINAALVFTAMNPRRNLPEASRKSMDAVSLALSISDKNRSKYNEAYNFKNEMDSMT